MRGIFAGRHLEFLYSPERKRLLLDDIEQTGAADYLRLARLVYFGNVDLELVRGSGEARRRLAALPPGEPGFLDVFADNRELTEAAEDVQKYPRGHPNPNSLLRRQLTSLRARSYAAAAADRADYLTYVGQLVILLAGGSPVGRSPRWPKI